MRVLIFLLCGLLFSSPHNLYGQHHDNIWILSDRDDSVIIDFSTGQPTVTLDNMDIVFEYASTYIANEMGELAFYTNGCQVKNANRTLMQNGSHLNPGEVYDEYCVFSQTKRYPHGIQASLSLPWPERESQYLILHKLSEFVYDSMGILMDVVAPRILTTHVDMDANDGLGRVVEKNVILEEAAYEFGGLTATKHANGKDWWIINPLVESNEYAVYLLDSLGFQHLGFQATGNVEALNESGVGQSVFSPDGSRYLRFHQTNGLQIWDFDRTTGLLSNFRLTNIPLAEITFAPYGGVGISPSGRYAYATNKFKVWQFDLEAEDLEAGRILVGEVTNPDSMFIAPTIFNFQLGPDCKLYGFNNSGTDYHVIHHPDSAGVACDFEESGLALPVWVFRDFPHFPNYRLGPLGDEGSPCAVPLISSTDAEPAPLPDPTYLTVYPTPPGRKSRYR